MLEAFNFLSRKRATYTKNLYSNPIGLLTQV